MRGTLLGISGLALATAMAAPQAANASAAFDIFGTLGVQVFGATDPSGGPLSSGNAFVQMNQTDAVFVVSTTGDTTLSTSTTDSTPGFGNAPQDGLGYVDVFGIANGDTRMAGFQVEYAGTATTAPAELSQVSGGAFALGIPGSNGGSQQLDFFSEIGATIQVGLFPIIDFPTFDADPGDSVSGGARFVIDNLATPGLDYTIQAIQTPGGLAVQSLGDIGFGPLEYNAGLITGPAFSFLQVAINVPASANVPASWVFGYETFATATAQPGPTGEIPVPAALPLLATAMGGLFWMRRRKSA